jgi:hypothetical protein
LIHIFREGSQIPIHSNKFQMTKKKKLFKSPSINGNQSLCRKSLCQKKNNKDVQKISGGSLF